MARQRVLNPEFFLDEELAMVSPHARLLYQGLWGICDDNYATLPNRPLWIKAQVFPYEAVEVAGLLSELEKIGKILLFEAKDGKEYWFVKNFFRYQRVDKPSKAKFPEYSDASRRIVGECSESPPSEEKRSKEKTQEKGGEVGPGETPVLPASNEDIPRQPSPAEIMRAFLDFPEKREEIVLWLVSKGIPEEVARREIAKFIAYWTEPTKSGKKQLWETKPTFELKRRLATWFERARERQRQMFKPQQQKYDPSIHGT
jgi:hypothetical protein